MLHADSFRPEQVTALAAGDYRAAELDPVDEAVAAFAEAVATRSNEVTQADIDALRAHGLDDVEIFDIVLAATARIFFSRTCDAIGFEPAAAWVERTRSLFGEEVFQALSVGRSFDREQAEAGA